MTIKQLRENAGLKAEEAAYKVGIALSTLRNWESGITEPSMGVLKMKHLLDVYRCSFDDLAIAVEETKKSKS